MNKRRHERVAARQSKRSTEHGAAAVEMALLLPVLLTLVMGIISFGMGYSTKITLSAGVREGARSLALGGTDADARQRVKDLTTKLNPPLADSDITISSRCPAGSTTGQAQLSATYALSYNLLFKKGTWNLKATGVMRCGL
jgi:Flp pilus assembly protein TadG